MAAAGLLSDFLRAQIGYAKLAQERIVVTGRVHDVCPWLAAADIAVCPLRIGGGVKMKMLEALAFGKPIVTTSIGAQGLEGATETPFLISDRPADFADNVVRLAQSSDERNHLSARARRYVRHLPTWDDSVAGLMEAYGWVIDPRAAPAVSSKRLAEIALAEGSAV
jgi:polysaccharide biosynthesis protein PslH